MLLPSSVDATPCRDDHDEPHRFGDKKVVFCLGNGSCVLPHTLDHEDARCGEAALEADREGRDEGMGDWDLEVEKAERPASWTFASCAGVCCSYTASSSSLSMEMRRRARGRRDGVARLLFDGGLRLMVLRTSRATAGSRSHVLVEVQRRQER